MAPKYISDFQVGDSIDEILYVSSKRVQNYKNKPGCFLNLVLSDRTGTIGCKFWDFNPEQSDVPEKSVIRCIGDVVEFADSPEIHLQSFEPVDKMTVDPADFLPVTPLDIRHMWAG
ncbi:MAG: hypothetical protein CVU89_14295 [Firmicutes bacterium HGW-Firmicutes-14]|nr:MAG: hypothetical protein CVU89_14295 [Firmicutes bacterium HGW-Firmicutes-14]